MAIGSLLFWCLSRWRDWIFGFSSSFFGGPGGCGFEDNVRAWGITFESFPQAVQFVPAVLGAVDSKHPRADVVFTQLHGKPHFSDWFVAGEDGPGSVHFCIQHVDQIAAEKAFASVFQEGERNISEEAGDGVGFLGLGAEGERGVPRESGPVAAGKVGQGEEGFPDIGGAVVEFRREFGRSCGDGLGVVLHKTGAFALELKSLEAAEAFTFFGLSFALHADEDTAVSEGIGEAAYGGHGFGAPAGEFAEAGTIGFGLFLAGRVLDNAQDPGAATGVAGVEDAPEFLIALEEGVGFVDEQGGPFFLNDAIESGRTDIGRGDCAMDELAENVQEGGFAAPFFG